MESGISLIKSGTTASRFSRAGAALPRRRNLTLEQAPINLPETHKLPLEGEAVKGKYFCSGMCSRSQNGDHKREESSLRKSGERIIQNKGMEPLKIQKTNWIAHEKLRKRLVSLKESPLSPKLKEI